MLDRVAGQAAEAGHDPRGAARRAREGNAPMMPLAQCVLRTSDQHHDIADHRSELMPRWCNGCGDNAILTAMQRLCRDEGLQPERTVFVSGIGCSSRLPHYMNAYGFHGTHGRAL